MRVALLLFIFAGLLGASVALAFPLRGGAGVVPTGSTLTDSANTELLADPTNAYILVH